VFGYLDLPNTRGIRAAGEVDAYIDVEQLQILGGAQIVHAPESGEHCSTMVFGPAFSFLGKE
jgi:hypothetical protein